MINDQSISNKISHMRFNVNRQSVIDFDHNCDMSMGDRLRSRRKELGFSQKDIANRTGLSQTTISDIERGRNQGSSEAPTIAHVLGVEALWLSDGKLPMLRLSTNVSEGPNIKGVVPLISWVQAGNWMEAVDSLQPGQGEQIETTVPIRRHTFALKVHGDSMTSDSGVSFPAGAIIIVEPEMQYESGDFVIVRNGDDEATFKQIIRDGADWILKPLNSRYPIKPMPPDAVVCGVVRGMEMRFK